MNIKPKRMREVASASGIRYPRQQRSQARFEAILGSAEQLLEQMDADAISIYTIAEASGLSPPSIYHFFPDTNQVFIALAEQILERFTAAYVHAPLGSFQTRQELLATRFREARDYYNQYAPARRLLLGSGLSAAIRARDLAVNRQLALRIIEEVDRHFIMPDTPELVERFTELLVINDALWALSVHRHDMITDAYEEQASRAREAFCRTFLPEYLPARQEAGHPANHAQP